MAEPPFPVCVSQKCDWTPSNVRSFSVCKTCGLYFNEKAKEQKYEKDYFFAEYERQYGKSYLDDKENIQRRMKWRLELLDQFLPPLSVGSKPPRLLEVGSACGFFLELASGRGFEVEGWEVSGSMSEIANRKGLKTLSGGFESLYQDWMKSPEKLDILAAFYVIEHFPQPFLFWEAARNLLGTGGLLILSMPSLHGPSFYFDRNREKWVEEHPQDHFVDYSPLSVEKIGESYSFRTLKIHAEGIHPERFPMGNFILSRGLYGWFQRKLIFSDTMFAILRRV